MSSDIKACRHRTVRRFIRQGRVVVFKCVGCGSFLETTLPLVMARMRPASRRRERRV